MIGGGRWKCVSESWCACFVVSVVDVSVLDVIGDDVSRECFVVSVVVWLMYVS